MGKRFVLDTNVLLHSPNSLTALGEENEVVIPIVTVEELDGFKTRPDATGANARAVIRLMDEVSEGGSLIDGAPLPNGGTLRVELNHHEPDILPHGLDIDKADHRILAVAAALQRDDPERPVVIVSNDLNLRVKARSMGIRAEAYRNDRLGPVTHPGIVRVIVDAALADEVDQGGMPLAELERRLLAPADEITESDYLLGLVQEHCACGATNTRKVQFYAQPEDVRWLCRSCLAQEVQRLDAADIDACFAADRKGDFAFGHGHVEEIRKAYWEVVGGRVVPISHYRTERRVWGSLVALNDEQVFALDALLNPQKKLVVLIGPQGSGKTLLTMAVGMELAEQGAAEQGGKVIYTREIIPMGRDLGALPGTEEEKMREWVMPAYDALEALMERPRRGRGPNQNHETLEERIDYLKRQGLLEFKAMSFFRGRSFAHRFLILDEAQNTSPHQASITVKRAGHGTKVVLLGDPDQIDSPYLTPGADGLSFIAQKMRGQDLFACVKLESAERSELAERCRQLGL